MADKKPAPARTLEDHVDAVHKARALHDEALADPSQTVAVDLPDGGTTEIPLALVTGKQLDDARHDAMHHLAHEGLGRAYAEARDLAEQDPTEENRAAEQQAALDLQTARQRIREAHGQPGVRVAGNAVRS